MHNDRYATAAEIGAELKAVMSERNVTQLELSQRIGVTQVTIWRQLDGRHDMPIGLFDRICKALGTTMAEVLNRVNSRYRHEAA